jgi:hypothetical protein
LFKISVIILSASIIFITSGVSDASVKVASTDLSRTIGNGDVKESPDGNNSAGAQNDKAARQDAPPLNIDEIVHLYSSEMDTPVYSKPDSKGKILCEWHSLDDVYGDSTPILNKSDNSKWYKILFEAGMFDISIRQVHKLSWYNYSYGYVDAKLITPEPLSDSERKYFEWIRNGKPPAEKVGDVFEAMRDTIGVTKVPVTLLKEPKIGAEEIKIPEGTRFVGPRYGTADSFPTYYSDMDEEDWSLIVDADTGKILGWIKVDEWNKVPTEYIGYEFEEL